MKVKVYCPRCRGTGKLHHSGHGAFGESESWDYDCPTCYGKGEVKAETTSENKLKNEKPLNYYGCAFDDPKEGYNEEFLKTKKGKKEIKKTKKSKNKLRKQIKENGFDDSECWNLDMTIAQFVLPRLKRLKDITHGYPGDLTPEEWSNIMDKMIFSFDYIVNDEDDAKEYEYHLYQEGIDLFAKYFRHLWD